MVVVAHNIDREIRRTLHSLSADYQRGADPTDYEIIVVDNGSDPPIDARWIETLNGQFQLLRIDNAPPSPAEAINRGIAAARGSVIGVMIDGARLATPGLVHFANHGARLHRRAIVATLGWYLGFDFQGLSRHPASQRAREDALLDSINWPSDGYRMFEIGAMDESSVDGWFQPIAESNALFLRRECWDELGGVDDRFDAPGGGLLNLDTFTRATELPDANLVVPLGEATFHQWHGGVNTNASPEQQARNWDRWSQSYADIRGKPYAVPEFNRPPVYIGTLPRAALARFVRAALYPAARGFQHPLGSSFDQALWSGQIVEASDENISRLVQLAREHFAHGKFEASCAVARLIHERAPDEPAIRDIQSLVGPSVTISGPDRSRAADYHVALGDAYRILGETERSAAEYRAALTFNTDLSPAHLGLSALRMPGDSYLVLLDRIYEALAPEIAVEVGIYEGASLALFRPPTIAIGVDPNAKILLPPKTETHVFAETSDEFFALRRYNTLVGDRPLSVGFIDGLHLFEQVLKDFIGLEALCGQRSVILIHDTVPLDEPTQRRDRDTIFHTGDVWKIVLCLKHYRPDLNIVTIATAPTGLTAVTGLNPISTILTNRYYEAIARFGGVSFSSIAAVAETALNIVPNDWNFVEAHLKGQSVL